MLFMIVLTGIILTGAGYHAGITAWTYELLRPVETMMGGLAGVRYIHHIVMWLFMLFLLYIFIWLSGTTAFFREGTVSSMISGLLFKKKNK